MSPREKERRDIAIGYYLRMVSLEIDHRDTNLMLKAINGARIFQDMLDRTTRCPHLITVPGPHDTLACFDCGAPVEERFSGNRFQQNEDQHR